MENKSLEPWFYGLAVLLVLVLGVRGCMYIGTKRYTTKKLVNRVVPEVGSVFKNTTYSEGERSGVITKFSHKGMPIKTWEGELNMGGFETGGVASTWAFSVDDPAIVEKIQEAQREGGRWTLKYRQQSWRDATDYFIIDVVRVHNESTN